MLEICLSRCLGDGSKCSIDEHSSSVYIPSQTYRAAAYALLPLVDRHSVQSDSRSQAAAARAAEVPAWIAALLAK
jgi:hypothetical protein